MKSTRLIIISYTGLSFPGSSSNCLFEQPSSRHFRPTSDSDSGAENPAPANNSDHGGHVNITCSISSSNLTSVVANSTTSGVANNPIASTSSSSSSSSSSCSFSVSSMKTPLKELCITIPTAKPSLNESKPQLSIESKLKTKSLYERLLLNFFNFF